MLLLALGAGAVSALDPDRDEARRLLEGELATGDYRLQEPWLTRLWDWFTGLFPDGAGGTLPPWTAWVLLAAVLTAAAAVIGYAARDRWRTQRLTARGPAGAVLEGARRSAQDYRAAAEAALRGGDAARALLEAYRAIAAGAIERTLLDDRLGRTAHEVAVALGPVFPGLGPALRSAADRFDAVRYGGQAATVDEAVAVLELDSAVRDARPELAAAPALGAAAGPGTAP